MKIGDWVNFNNHNASMSDVFHNINEYTKIISGRCFRVKNLEEEYLELDDLSFKYKKTSFEYNLPFTRKMKIKSLLEC